MDHSSISDIENQLTEISMLANRSEGELLAVCEAVSAWSPAEHLDHTMKVCSSVLNGILSGRLPLPRGVTLLGRAILLIGRIPRGRGESPQRFRGTPASPQEIAGATAEVRLQLSRLKEPGFHALAGPIIRHHVFGGLTSSQALRFLAVHNRHHLRIIAEIFRAR